MPSLSRAFYAAVILICIALTAFIEWQMGRPFFCECGVIRFWVGDIWSNQNSQQFTDPYTFSHILHGIFFYLFIWMVFGKRLRLMPRLLIAVFLECGWEILENSSFIIDRYRAHTISLDYYGDSIFNSISDIIAMMFGFYLAWKLPWKWILVFVVAVELLLLFLVRDNLTLNVIMLVHPIEAIKAWQTPLH